MNMERDSEYADEREQNEQPETNEEAQYEDEYGRYGETEEEEETDGAADEEEEDGMGDATAQAGDDVVYFMNTLNFLEKELMESTAVPLTNKRLVDVDKCRSILDDMRNSIPDAIRLGWSVYAEQDRLLDRAEEMAQNKAGAANVKAKSIVDEAESDAAAIRNEASQEYERVLNEAQYQAQEILNDAEQQARSMIDESEVMQQATAEAEALRKNAREEANGFRRSAVNDGYRLLDSLEKQVRAYAEKLKNTKREMTGRD